MTETENVLVRVSDDDGNTGVGAAALSGGEIRLDASVAGTGVQPTD